MFVLILATLQAGSGGQNIVEFRKTHKQITSNINREPTRISTEPNLFYDNIRDSVHVIPFFNLLLSPGIRDFFPRNISLYYW